MTWRSIIHMLFEKFGMHDIANLVVLSGDPDPMPLIYMFFSLWGIFWKILEMNGSQNTCSITDGGTVDNILVSFSYSFALQTSI